jgi:hypothetical protein
LERSLFSLTKRNTQSLPTPSLIPDTYADEDDDLHIHTHMRDAGGERARSESPEQKAAGDLEEAAEENRMMPPRSEHDDESSAGR